MELENPTPFEEILQVNKDAAREGVFANYLNSLEIGLGVWAQLGLEAIRPRP